MLIDKSASRYISSTRRQAGSGTVSQ